MNFCVELHPGPPYSFGQFGQSQPLLASFFCHCSSRSLETWLVRLRRLSSATSGGMLAAIQSRTSFWKASSSSLKARSISSLHDGEEAPPLRFAPVGVTACYSPSITLDMIPRCTSDEPP